MISGRVVGISYPGKIAYATGDFKARNMGTLVKYLLHMRFNDAIHLNNNTGIGLGSGVHTDDHQFVRWRALRTANFWWSPAGQRLTGRTQKPKSQLSPCPTSGT